MIKKVLSFLFQKRIIARLKEKIMFVTNHTICLSKILTDLSAVKQKIKIRNILNIDKTQGKLLNNKW